MMYDHVPPRRLQRWYVPVIGAAVAAGVSEVLQMLVSFSRGGLHSSIALMLVQFAIGAVDGVFLALVLALSWALTSTLFSRDIRGRAA
jgi:hypothetical protein